ncbi:hypothetical protein CAEBREN_04480 [Caenorhabditis brenneri]|uniref:Serpentine Receptor, class I n=1 Tax=Caenorhabditis brenneri TaxID=135651 RepID=G0NL66_CAEBE|nr:hypothetical protein CAEBREN_04480 [Caenorhabditis brenneri]
MYDIDFNIPYWLIIYYHCIGTVSLIFDAFSIYLVLFKSEKIDNFRYFLLNFQISCCVTDIHITFLMQPVPLYPLVAGYTLGLLPRLGATSHFSMCIMIGCIIYQIESMIFCFIQKHQGIARPLQKMHIPNILVKLIFCLFAFYTCAVVVLYSRACVPSEKNIEYLEKNFPEYIAGFNSLPNYTICEADEYFVKVVIFAVSCGVITFILFCIILGNIFRMLKILKLKISVVSYKKHKVRVWSLLAQFATSAVCFVPPLFFVFVIMVGMDGAQVIVLFILVIACFHSTLNVSVLIITFPPYRKYVTFVLWRGRKSESRIDFFNGRQSLVGILVVG